MGPSLICCELDGSAQPIVIGDGAYPAAVNGGVLWAALAENNKTLCTTLRRWDGQQSQDVFTMEADSRWGLSDIWAFGDIRAVAFSAADSSLGSYVGIWRGDFESLVCLIATDAPRVIGSLNQS